ncbi:uncharacterized protein LOC105691802 [Athalia rosae]|uniref:uncharacterized protein LOC105691802 n=1 Tax=Athalia rosae TaxID=37344 RepID=UPI002033D23A|nr:uncharacterized protein LOC105691802 [Athalia rosae]
MGSKFSAIINRLFEYPIKRKPICFHRQEDFTSTGEPIPRSDDVAKEPPTEFKIELLHDQCFRYEKLVQTFYARLLEQRRHAKQMQEKDKRWPVLKILEKLPGWNEMTISNLHSLFLLFDNQKTGMLSHPDFCAVLESLGDSSSADLRKVKFDEADGDGDGWITYDEFLDLLYNFTPPEGGELSGVAKLCYDIAENVRFVSSLSIGEQLEYGLF